MEPIVKLPTLPRGPGTTDAPPLEAEDDQGEGNEEQKKQLDNELRRDLEFLMAEESRLVDEKLAAATKAAIAQMLPQIEKEVEKEAQQELQEKRDLILAMWQEMREQSQPRIPQDLDAAMPTTPVADTQPDKRSRTVAIGDTPDQSRAKMRIYLDVLEIEDKREKALLAKSRALEDELMGVRRIKEHLLSLMQDAKHNI